MGTLETLGATLHYETRGDGPLMVMVPGASGTGDSFTKAAEHLAAHYTVATYDRRGFSRSLLDGPQDYTHRLDTDVDDVRRLIEHLGAAPAIVFGASSGGVIALELLARHPAVVRTLVAFEPAAVRQLPDGQRWVDFFGEIYGLYRDAGAAVALEKFREQTFAESDRRFMAKATAHGDAERMRANAAYWFEHELRQYPAVDLDIDAIKAYADRVVLMAGRDSRGHPTYDVNVVLGRKLGRRLIEMPGGHIGCLTYPAEFADELALALHAWFDTRTGDRATPGGHTPV